jgi:hypothetical protein
MSPQQRNGLIKTDSAPNDLSISCVDHVTDDRSAASGLDMSFDAVVYDFAAAVYMSTDPLTFM